jgi:hypothetical protein
MSSKRGRKNVCGKKADQMAGIMLISRQEATALNKINKQCKDLMDKREQREDARCDKTLEGWHKDSGDFHAWVENAAGEVVGEKTFPEYATIQQINKCHGQVKYKRWSPEHEAEKWAHCQGKIRYYLAQQKAVNKVTGRKKSMWDQFANGGKFLQCPMNASKYLIDQKKLDNHDVRICLGSMGWEKDDGSGVWWEYGLGNE